VDLPGALSSRLGLSPDQSEVLAAVVVGGLRFRVADELGEPIAGRLDAAIPELQRWQRAGGLAAEIDAQRLAWQQNSRQSRDIALIAEVLYGLGAEPAGADLVPDVVRAFLEDRLEPRTVKRLAQVAPFLTGSEATPVPTSRWRVASGGPPK